MLPPLRALLSGALVVSALLAISACARNAQPPPLRVALVADDGPQRDAALNESAREGIAAAKRLLGAEVAVASAKSRAEFVSETTLFADEDYDEIFGVGPAAGFALTEVARRYPRRNFALLGAASEEPNIASIDFAVEQGAFLAGALAATIARGRAIELDAGAGTDANALRSGFIAGLREMRATRPPRGARAQSGAAPAATLYDAGDALAFATVAGARRGTVLARVVRRADVAVLDVSADARSLKVAAGRTPFGLARRGVELGLTALAKRSAGAAGLARLTSLRDAVAAGRIVVPRTAAGSAAFKPVPL
jgi:basic membrane lipoprotein Med (substrate-binding protein (PBP1-ABC) superfamily)